MKKAWPVLMVVGILVVCIIGGMFIYNAIENKKQIEAAERLREEQMQIEQQMEDFLSMLPATFKVRPQDSDGYISNLDVKIERCQDERGDLMIEMAPSIGEYSKDITYYGGPATLEREGLLAHCEWVPDFRVQEKKREAIVTETSKKYATKDIYLYNDNVNLETGEVEIYSSNLPQPNNFVLVKQGS